MKPIEEMEKLSAEDLERIGADESIPVPEDLSVRLPARKAPVFAWSAAAAVLLVAGFIGFNRPKAPADTFSDPLLAYAAVEDAFAKISGSINSASMKVEEAETTFNKLNYWK